VHIKIIVSFLLPLSCSHFVL